MKAAILKCKAGSRFHFGRYAPDSDTALNDTAETMHSDTLFAALVNTYNDLFNDTDDFVECFEQGDISLSSVFFCIEQNGNFVWFLPKPILFDLVDVEDYKSFKRIRYISKKLWEYINSPQELAELMKTEEKKVVVIKNAFVMFRNEIKVVLDNEEAWKDLKIYESINLPKVQVRERKNEGNLYQMNLIEIADNSTLALGLNVHYYFLYQFSSKLKESFVKRFRQVLTVIGHSGIGAERSTIGQLEEIILDEKKWEDPSGDSESRCTLSLISPLESDLALLQYYRTLLRGGRAIGKQNFIEVNGRRELKQMHLKSLRMIAEGAVVNGEVKGCLHSIDPENPDGISIPKFKRCGTALTLPLKKSWLL